MLEPESTSLLGKAHSFCKVFKLKIVPKLYQLTNDNVSAFVLGRKNLLTCHAFSPHIHPWGGRAIRGDSLAGSKM